MRIVVALGGNALLRWGQPAEAEAQRENVETAARGLATIAADHELILTHGNGPRVGLLALQSEDSEEVGAYPLEVHGAESEGMVGHTLELALRNALPDRDVVTVLTEVVVDPQDPAFANASKPIGPTHSAAEARRLALERGWTVGREGDSYRRLLPTPQPGAVAALRSLRLLIDSGALVVCAGGAIPVSFDAAGTLRGVEAAIDKDLTAALLARRLDADLLLMLTDVDAVHLDWGGEDDRPLRQTDPLELRGLSFAAGSMGTKVEAACRFVEATGGRAAIGALADAVAMVAGEAGTQVEPRAVGAKSS